MKARVSQLHRTEAEWAKLSKFIPAVAELIVYDPDDKHDYARLKIGDGKKFLEDLPFFVDSSIAAYLQKPNIQDVIDGGRIVSKKK